VEEKSSNSPLEKTTKNEEEVTISVVVGDRSFSEENRNLQSGSTERGGVIRGKPRTIQHKCEKGDVQAIISS